MKAHQHNAHLVDYAMHSIAMALGLYPPPAGWADWYALGDELI